MFFTDSDKLTDLISTRQSKDNFKRIAFISALLMQKCVSLKTGETPAGDLIEPALNPYRAALAATTLCKYAAMIESFAVLQCNQELTSIQEQNQQLNIDKFTELANALGFRAKTAGDPRGCVAKLYDPADETAGDLMGGGWGVW